MSNLNTQLDQGSPINGTTTSQNGAITLKICNKYDSDDADIELISSDNVKFKVHSYRLQSASPVFRSMIALAKSASQRDSLHLTDTRFETRRVIVRALNIMYTLEFDFDSGSYDSGIVLSIVEFARKWEISLIIDFMVRNLDENLNRKDEPLYPFDEFLIALKLKKNRLAAAYAMSLQKCKGWRREDAEPKEVGEISKHPLCNTPKATLSQTHPLLDIDCEEYNALGMIPHEFFILLQPTVGWIILRAQALKGKTALSQEQIIRQLLDLAFESIFHTSRFGSRADLRSAIWIRRVEQEEESRRLMEG